MNRFKLKPFSSIGGGGNFKKQIYEIVTTTIIFKIQAGYFVACIYLYSNP